MEHRDESMALGRKRGHSSDASNVDGQIENLEIETKKSRRSWKIMEDLYLVGGIPTPLNKIRVRQL